MSFSANLLVFSALSGPWLPVTKNMEGKKVDRIDESLDFNKTQLLKLSAFDEERPGRCPRYSVLVSNVTSS
jgi:hypothetical protein